MIMIRRKASPRKPQKYDYKNVRKKHLSRYLKSGWVEEGDAEEEEEQEPEPEQNGIIAPKDLTFKQKKAIAEAEGTQREIAERFSVSTYTVHRLKTGKL